MSVSEPPLTQVATLLNGLATVTFPSKPYRRVATHINLTNPVGGNVTVYVGGLVANTQVTSTANGNQNDYTVPFNVPAGQSVFVQWATAPTPVSSAFATLTCVRETR
jgi:hypothetical protein